MAAAHIAGHRRLRDRDARRRHHADLAIPDHLSWPGDPDSDGFGRLPAMSPPGFGAEPVARAVIARQNVGDESIAHRRPSLDHLETASVAVPERLSRGLPARD